MDPESPESPAGRADQARARGRRGPAPGRPASWWSTTSRPTSRCSPACSRPAGTRSGRSRAASWPCWRRGRSRPDLILLDINMPEMDGYEVCRRLKADEALRGIPVIFISALNENLDKVNAFAIGGVDYITKPFQMEELHARVETHLKLRRLQVELEEANARLEKANGRMSRDLEAAAKIQAAFLPRAAPAVAGARVRLGLSALRRAGRRRAEHHPARRREGRPLRPRRQRPRRLGGPALGDPQPPPLAALGAVLDPGPATGTPPIRPTSRRPPRSPTA